MRVIITGGSGYIGTALAESLVNDGHDVLVLSRNPSALSIRSHKAIRLLQWDGKTANGWGEHINKIDAVVNFAGENLSTKRWSNSTKQTILSSRLDAGQAVTQAIQNARHKPAVLIQASAVGYYGATGDSPVTEDNLPGTDYLADVCVKWEESTQSVETLGVRRAIIRTGLPLSLSGGVLPRLLMPVKLFIGGPLGNGKQFFPWIHMEDNIAAIRFLIENNQASGAYNISAPRPLTNREFVRQIGKILKRPTILPVPPSALRILFGEMADAMLLSGQRMLPNRLQNQGFIFRYPDAESALKNILLRRQN